MDVIVRSINNTVNDMIGLMSGLINDFDKAMKRVVKVCLVSDCSGLSTRQTSHRRLFT